MRLTAKQEAFAVNVASGMPSVAAYRQAYQPKGSPETVRKDSGRLAAKPDVAARIAELRNGYARAAVEASRGPIDATKAPRAYSVAEAMEELDKVGQRAEEYKQIGVMAKVVELRMKLYGLGIGDAKNPADKDEMTPEELEAALRDVRAARAAQVVPLKAVKK